MLPFHSMEYKEVLAEAKAIAAKKLIGKGFSPEQVYGSIERKDEKELRRMLKKFSRKELKNLFREEEW